ncbi:hypothetical protein Hanom_Chr03g00194451 [Helianthus anomalus]
MIIFVCIHRVLVFNICAHVMIVMLQVYMSSFESGLSEEHDPLAIVSEDEDEDDFQRFALPDFGDDVPIADGFPVEDPFDFPTPIHDHLIIGHAMVSILSHLSSTLFPSWSFFLRIGLLMIFLVMMSILFFDSPQVDVQDDREVDDDVAILDPDIAPLVPEPIPAPIDLPLVDPFIPPPPPADVAPPLPFISDAHRTDLPIVFLQEIPTPRPGKGTSGQPRDLICLLRPISL